jgi:hypothetical protein
MANELCSSLPILNVVPSNDTYQFLVSTASSPSPVMPLHNLLASGLVQIHVETPGPAPSSLGNFKIFLFYFRNIYLKPATVNCVGSVKPPKKAGRPVIVELNPNFEILSQMRNLQITFLNDDGQCFLQPASNRCQ